jgi:hypothetical protein
VDDVSELQIADEFVAAEPEPVQSRGLNQPWRGLVALAELIVAGLVLWAAFWCWSRAGSTITLVLGDGTELRSTRSVGHWMAAAIALGSVTGVLVLDALRQIVLAVRVRPRRKPEQPAHS